MNDADRRRFRLILEREQIDTVAKLDAFLAADPKTKDDVRARGQWRALLLTAAPELVSVAALEP